METPDFNSILNAKSPGLNRAMDIEFDFLESLQSQQTQADEPQAFTLEESLMEFDFASYLQESGFASGGETVQEMEGELEKELTFGVQPQF